MAKNKDKATAQSAAAKTNAKYKTSSNLGSAKGRKKWKPPTSNLKTGKNPCTGKAYIVFDETGFPTAVYQTYIGAKTNKVQGGRIYRLDQLQSKADASGQIAYLNRRIAWITNQYNTSMDNLRNKKEENPKIEIEDMVIDLEKSRDSDVAHFENVKHYIQTWANKIQYVIDNPSILERLGL